jgi:hypothetical protein
MTTALAAGEPSLRSFVTGLRADQDAVANGLNLPWSSGAVEGHVNRIKDAQTTNVWTRRTRPAPPPHPPRRLSPPKRPRKILPEPRFGRSRHLTSRRGRASQHSHRLSPRPRHPAALHDETHDLGYRRLLCVRISLSARQSGPRSDPSKAQGFR